MTWDEYFFSIIEVVRQKSKDRSIKVGTVIVGSGNAVVSTGWNGFPRGVDDDVEERHTRPEKYLWTEHAERNAIFNAARIGVPLEGCTIYLDMYPCCRCARAIIQAGITELVLDGRNWKEKEKYWSERWGDELIKSVVMLREAKVEVRFGELEK